MPTKIAFFFSALCKISSFFSSDFLLGCDTCDSKKTTSLLECARYTYARGKCSMRFFPFSCSALLSSSLRFCADNKLYSVHFDKSDYQIGYKHKIRYQFFAIFSLFGAISPHIHIGAHDGGVHHFPFSFTAKAKLIYKSCLLLVVLWQERKKLREVFDNVRRDRFIYGLWRPFFPTKPDGFAP